MSLGQRIRILREHAQVTQKDLAKELNMANSTLSQYESDLRVPSDAIKSRIADYFGVTVDYLLGRESAAPKGNPFSGRNGVLRIPVLGDVAAGIPIEAVQDIVDYEEIDAAMASSGEFFGLRIKGSSMEPRMREGDVVIVRKQDYADTGDTAVVLINGDSATVKRIKIGPNGLSLISTNPSYDPMYYTAAEVESLPVRIIGRVVELRAKY